MKRPMKERPYNDGNRTTTQKRHILNYVIQSSEIAYWLVVDRETARILAFDIKYTDENIDYYMDKALNIYLASIETANVFNKEKKIKLIKHFLKGEKL